MKSQDCLRTGYVQANLEFIRVVKGYCASVFFALTGFVNSTKQQNFRVQNYNIYNINTGFKNTKWGFLNLSQTTKLDSSKLKEFADDTF